MVCERQGQELRDQRSLRKPVLVPTPRWYFSCTACSANLPCTVVAVWVLLGLELATFGIFEMAAFTFAALYCLVHPYEHVCTLAHPWSL